MTTLTTPKSFVRDAFEIEFTVNALCTDVHEWLMRKDTFSSGQLPPYKVEFLQNTLSEYMLLGDKTNHHGPFIQFAGEITKVDPGQYRRLDYYYGSYALSFRWARPVCLEITTTPTENKSTLVKLGLQTDVHWFFAPIWKLMMLLFWNQFVVNVKILWFFKNYFKRQNR